LRCPQESRIHARGYPWLIFQAEEVKQSAIKLGTLLKAYLFPYRGIIPPVGSLVPLFFKGVAS